MESKAIAHEQELMNNLFDTVHYDETPGDWRNMPETEPPDDDEMEIPNDAFVKGGPGSGPRPGQSKKTITAYHGTSSEVLDNIKQNGIQVTGSRTFGAGELYQGERGESVYVTTSESDAEDYARNAVGNFEQFEDDDPRPAIVTLKVPKEEWSKFKNDSKSSSGSKLYIGKIPAKWISSTEILKLEIQTAYVVIFTVDNNTVEKRTIDRAAHEAATSVRNDLPEPSDDQKSAGNYRMGHINVGGIDITIENPKGSRRRPNWETLKAHYGYIRLTSGADGDQIDVFVREGTDDSWTGPVYVIDQHINGEFDEHKVMLGFFSQQEATKAYLGSYQAGWKLGPVTRWNWRRFTAWVAQRQHTEPVSQG